MRRTITGDGVKWTVTNTGMSHDINDIHHSTGLRFEAEDGTEVFGRYRIEPEKNRFRFGRSIRRSVAGCD